jgi:cobalt/nickel transport system permease protein/cobalt/nickel transport protein
MRRKKIILIVALSIFLVALLATASAWDGDITEHAAENLAPDAGETQILPWKIEGDLLLFFFLAGGAIAGFAAGYYWRKLFAETGSKEQEPVAAEEDAA